VGTRGPDPCQHALADREVVRRGACTWAHQAAEKALKAVLVSVGSDPPKIHDLSRLARLTDESARAELAVLDLVELTRWAIEGRYPSDLEDASAGDADAAVRIADQVVGVAGAIVGGDGERSGSSPEPDDDAPTSEPRPT
jgi:HEPN domain-containing protein